MAVVRLGNEAAVEGYRAQDGSDARRPIPGRRVTTATVPGTRTLADAFRDITHQGGVWAAHSQEGARPAWAESDWPELQMLLRSHFRCGARPDTWTEGGV